MGFDVFPHNLYNIKNRQWWLTTGTEVTMSNITTAHTNILQTMLAQFHALCLNITKHRVHSTHIRVNNAHLQTKSQQKQEECTLHYNVKKGKPGS